MPEQRVANTADGQGFDCDSLGKYNISLEKSLALHQKESSVFAGFAYADDGVRYSGRLSSHTSVPCFPLSAGIAHTPERKEQF
ncbi:MAG: hypothetical protein LBR29_02400 [Methylobacteriaceae bacterium]|jgi:hypothetical protein|nr:hypothetical protein [Methylobacteriaceae bacterium]